MKIIPLNPPFSKGEKRYPPLEKGGKGDLKGYFRVNILMVGAGGVGGYYGAVLMKAGAKVSFLVTPRSLPILKSNGLTVKSKGEVWNFRPPVSTDPMDLAPCDLIIIAVKRYDTYKALDTIQPVVTKDTIILTIQNGIDGEEERLKGFLVPMYLEGL